MSTKEEILLYCLSHKIKLFVDDGGIALRALSDTVEIPESLRREVAHHADELRLLLESGGDSYSGLVHHPFSNDACYPTSYEQKNFWIISQIGNQNNNYNVAFNYEINGNLNLPALNDTFQILIKKHQAFRTSLLYDDCALFQRIRTPDEFQMSIRPEPSIPLTSGEIENLLRDNLLKEFDFENDYLLRVLLIRISDEKAVLSIVSHHVAMDGFSVGLLESDISEIYSALVGGRDYPIDPERIDYLDYAIWQESKLRNREYDSHVAYWRGYISGAPELHTFAIDKSRPKAESFDGAIYVQTLDDEISAAIVDFGKKVGVSTYVVLQALLTAFLYRFSESDDIVIGTTNANRYRKEIGKVIGTFANLNLLRAKFSSALTFSQHIKNVFADYKSSSTYQAFPFESLVEAVNPHRSLDHSPIFQILLSFHNSAPRDLCLEHLECARLGQQTYRNRYDLTFDISIVGGRFQINWEYATELFLKSSISRLSKNLECFWREAVHFPNRPIDFLNAMSAEEKELILGQGEVSQKQDLPVRKISDLFVEFASENPEQVALTVDNSDYTYGEIDRLSDLLAARLLVSGVKGNDVVAIYIDRSLELVVCLIAALKSGAAFLPLDISYPKKRIEYMLDDANVDFILARSRDRSWFSPAYHNKLIHLDSLAKNKPDSQPFVSVAENNDYGGYAYIIYTSGSTGLPKGVVIEHKALLNFYYAISKKVALNNSTWLATTSVSFDISVLELLCPLAAGSRVVLAQDFNTYELSSGVHSDKNINFSLFFFASNELDEATSKHKLLLESAIFADANDFEAVWMPERYDGKFRGVNSSSAVNFADLCKITRNIQIRGGISVFPLYHPGQLAEDWSAVDNLSNGRAGLAFASGWHPNHFALMPDNFKDRHNVLFRYLEEVRSLWRGKPIRKADAVDDEVELGIHPLPAKEVPIWLTISDNPEAFRFAGEMGLNVLTHLLTHDLEELGKKIKIYREARRNNGFQEEGAVTLMLPTFVAETTGDVQAYAVEPFKAYITDSLNLSNTAATEDGADNTAENKEAVLERAVLRYLENNALIGTVAHCEKMIDRIKGIGVTEVSCLLDFGISSEVVLKNLKYLNELRATTAVGSNRDYKEYIKSQILEQNVTHFQSTPTLLSALLEDPEAFTYLGRLTELLVGGEELPSRIETQLKALSGPAVTNLYGPTEATIWATSDTLSQHNETTIGVSLCNTSVNILTTSRQLAPIGVKGELYIGGRSLSAGYLNRPKLTHERFVENQWREGKLYKTGDIVKWRADKKIVYLGRGDEQVKLRGFRIELGEIEKCITQLAWIMGCVVIVSLQDGGESAVLTAFIKKKAPLEEGEAISAIREHVEGHLPGYMVPSRFYFIEEFPLTLNGKIDRNILKTPDSGQSQMGTAYVAPKNDVQKVLTEIWKEVLGLESVGITENFFTLGGDSMQAIRVRSLANNKGIELTTRTIFAYQTIEKISSCAVTREVCRQKYESSGTFTLLPAQVRFFEIDSSAINALLQSYLLKVPANFDFSFLQHFLREVYRRHDALRLRFDTHNGEWRSYFAPFSEEVVDGNIKYVSLEECSVSDIKTAYLEVSLSVKREISAEHGDLIKFCFLETENERDSRLFIVAHHLIMDGASWRILFEEINCAYKQWTNNEAIKLGEKGDSYQDWAEYLREYSASTALQGDKEYWLKNLNFEVPSIPVERRIPIAFHKSSVFLSFELDKELTTYLLGSANEAYGTNVHELLLAALVYAFGLWCGIGRIKLKIEGHGREKLDRNFDLSQTLGRFTSMYPVMLGVDAEFEEGARYIDALLKCVKEQMRAVPQKGTSFGILRYLTRDPEIVQADDKSSTLLMFNYSGRFSESDKNFFPPSWEDTGPDARAERKRETDFALNIRINNNKMVFILDYSADQYEAGCIQEFMRSYESAIIQISGHCRAIERRIFTPSDFQAIHISQEQLDYLLDGVFVEDIYPATKTQMGLIFHSLLGDKKGVYAIQRCLTIKDLNLDVMKATWSYLVARHAAFRTCFRRLDSNEPLQVVSSSVKLPWVEFDWRDESEVAGESSFQSYRLVDKALDFELGVAPLFRLALFRLKDDTCKFLLTTHHSILDGWSIAIVIKEMEVIYRAVRNGASPYLAPPPLYREFVLESIKTDKEEARRFWTRLLSDIESPSILNLGAPGGDETAQGKRVATLSLNSDLGDRLVVAAKGYRVTTATVLKAAWAYVLSAYVDQDEVIFGETISGRFSQVENVESMVGLLISTIPVKVSVDFHKDVAPWLLDLQSSFFNMADYSCLPLPEIQKCCALSDLSLFNTLFIFQNYSEFVTEAVKNNDLVEALKVENTSVFEDTNYSLIVSIDEESGFELTVEYDERLFSRKAVDDLLHHYKRSIEGVVAEGERQIGDIGLLDEREVERQLEQYAVTRDNYSVRSFVVAYDDHVETFGQRTAVLYDGAEVSYAGLDWKVNGILSALSAKGIGAGEIVGVLAERNADYLATLVAILKIGAVYLPLNPESPASYLAAIVRDSNLSLLLVDRNTLALSEKVVSLATALPDSAVMSIEEAVTSTVPIAPIPEAGGTEPAYLIYTSGSTGKPKGVLIEHRGMDNHLNAKIHDLSIGPEDVVAQNATQIFDISIWQFLAPLMAGARVSIFAEYECKDPVQLVNRLIVDKVSILEVVPTILGAIIEYLETEASRESIAQIASRLRYLIPTGEMLNLGLCRQWFALFPEIPIINAYGPTECSDDVTHFKLSADLLDCYRNTPIGKPLINTRLYILDRHKNLLPEGAVGRLYCGGCGVGRGYLNAPHTTRMKFIQNPFAEGDGERLYDTGDLARWLPDGNLEFLGRSDFQIKIRGYRIELHEIENQLLSHATVRQCHVVAMELKGSKEKRLTAYVVPVSGQGVDTGRFLEELREYGLEKLPDYMVPSHYICLEEMPVTVNGKVDRKALPEPESKDVIKDDYVAPQTEEQAALCAIWEEVLGLERVGVEDNFFALGGDSILSIQIASRSRARGVGISIRQLFEYPTIRELARHVDSGSGPTFSQAAVTGEQLLLPIHREYFAAPLVDIDYYHQSQLLHVPEDFVYGFLEAFLAQVFRRHDAFRLRYRLEDGEWRAFYAPYSEDMVAQAVERVSLEGADETDRARQLEALGTEVKRRLNIERGPLFKAVYFESAQRGASRLLLVGHHLVIDGVSWRILLTDLGEAYGQWRRGEGLVLGAKTTSYQAWGERLQAYGESEALQGEREYWKGQLSQALQALPVDHEEVEDRSHGATRAVEFALDEDETRALLSESHGPYRTRIVELLLSGLLLGFYRWTGDRSLRVMMEGHGRESLFEDVDLSQTVGWFTSVYPLQLELPAGVELGDELSLGGLIKGVKESVRGIPHNGIGYGVLRHLCGDGELAGLEAGAGSTVVFNYLGQFDQQLGREELFTGAEEATGSDVGPRRECNYQLEFNGGVYNGRLRFVLDYNGGQYERETMERLLSYFADGLRSVIGHCRLSGVGGYTVSDFPLVNHVSQAELDKWQRDYPALEDLYPATGMQMGLIFHSLMDGGEGAYVIHLLMGIENLDVKSYKRAWEYLVSRHAVLRTAIVHLDSGQPLQFVLSAVDLPWHEENLQDLGDDARKAHIERYRLADKATGFDLAQAPLLRLALFREKDASYKFLLTFHHSISDGWSLAVILREVEAAYTSIRQDRMPKLALLTPYREYIAEIISKDKEKAQAFWRSLLADVEQPTLIKADLPQEHDSLRRIGSVVLQLDETATANLEKASRSYRVTPSTILKAALGYLLASYTDQDEVVFGETVSGRLGQVENIDSMVGMFISTIPVKVPVDVMDVVAQWLPALQKNFFEMDSYSYLSLADIQKCSQVDNGSHLFNTLFIFQNYPAYSNPAVGKSSEGGVFEIAERVIFEETNYDLTIQVGLTETIDLVAEYDERLFSRKAVDDLLHHYKRSIEGVVAEGERQIGDIGLLDEREVERQLEQYAVTRDNYSVRSFVVAYDDHVETFGQRTAVLYDGAEVSYAGLDWKVNGILSALSAKGIGAGEIVGVLAERNADYLATLVAILKIGAVYLPLNPESPASYLAAIVRDSNLSLLLVDRNTLALSEKVVSLATALPDSAVMSIEEAVTSTVPIAPIPEAGGTEPAYLIYTSGSTGKPKGVLIEHRGMDNHLNAKIHDLSIGPEDVVAQNATQIFDISIWQFLAPLMAGARVSIFAEYECKDPVQLVNRLIVDKVSILEVVPTILGAIIEYLETEASRESIAQIASRLRYLIPTGEMLNLGLCRQWFALFPEIPIINAYGPTECSDDVTHFKLSADLLDCYRNTPIGKPLINTRLYILDRHKNLLPEGAVGRLYCGGCGVGRGYLNAPHTTRMKFIQNPFAEGDGERLYDTGDLARWLPDGNLEFLGRSDFQIKIRGYRIELHEIENQLLSHATVRQCHVVAMELKGSKEKRLTAYVVPVSGQGVDTGRFLEELREYGLEKLPDYMVPSHYICLEEMPVTVNGKVDRKALPEPESKDVIKDDYVAPQTEEQAALCAIWEEVLGLERVGVEDNFFALGGDSIIAIQVVSKSRARGYALEIRKLFEHPVIMDLSKHIEMKTIDIPQEDSEGEMILLPVHQEFLSDFSDD